MSETIRVTEPRELLALVPYQLGFTPTDSAVVVALRGDRGRVGLIARVNLSDTAQAATTLVRHMIDDGAARLVVVIYSDETTTAKAASDVLTETAEAADLPASSWAVSSTGYRALDCTDTNCCPPQGRPLDDLTGTQVAATFTVHGAVIAPDRAALGVTPATGPERTAAVRAARAWLRDHIPGTVETRTAGLAVWRTAHGTDGEVRPDVLAVVSAALTDILVRDAVLCTLIPDADPTLAEKVLTGDDPDGVARAMLAIVSPLDGVQPGAAADRATTLLTQVAAYSAARRTPAPLTLLALIAWWGGDGAKSGVLVQQALAADPEYRLALLVRDMLTIALPPGWVRRAQ